MLVSIFNKAHYIVNVGEFTFRPFEEIDINVYTEQEIFRQIRARKELRVGKTNNEHYIKKHNLKVANIINFCYDIVNNLTDKAYEHAIEALSNPIMKHIPKEMCGYVNRPLPKMNCRFFSSLRINQRGKIPVGPNDVFFSHGIGDKNYWIGNHIKDFKYAFVPGPAWEKRMRDTNYKGEIFICGYTKLDPLINGEYEKTKRKKPYILWAPTHGYNSKDKGRSSYPQCLELIKQIPDCYETGLALHPTSKFNTRKGHNPTMQELIDADVVIADAGSTLYEAWILGKPVIFPDWICKKDVLNHFKKDENNFEYKIYAYKIGYHAKDMQQLIELIDVALEKKMSCVEQEFIDEIYPQKLRGKAGETAARQLIDLANSLGLK